MPTLTTREKLIQAGHEIFYREGFLAVGLDRLLNEVGCSKQTFYNHFDSKDDLIVAVIDEHHRWWSNELRDRIERAAGPDPRGQILAIFDVMHEIMHEPEYHGCIFINAAVEFPQSHHPAHQSARKAKADGVALLVELAERAGAADPVAVAQEIDMIIEGALIHPHIRVHAILFGHDHADRLPFHQNRIPAEPDYEAGKRRKNQLTFLPRNLCLQFEGIIRGLV